MTEQEFRNRSFKKGQLLDYLHPRTQERVECILTAINFDGGTLCLWTIPFETETHILKEQEYWVSYEYVFPPKNKLKAVK